MTKIIFQETISYQFKNCNLQVGISLTTNYSQKQINYLENLD